MDQMRHLAIVGDSKLEKVLMGQNENIIKGNGSSRAIRFAYAYWIVVVVPAMIMIYGCMPVLLPIILSWTVSGFIYGLIAGYIFVKLNP